MWNPPPDRSTYPQLSVDDFDLSKMINRLFCLNKKICWPRCNKPGRVLSHINLLNSSVNVDICKETDACCGPSFPLVRGTHSDSWNSYSGFFLSLGWWVERLLSLSQETTSIVRDLQSPGISEGPESRLVFVLFRRQRRKLDSDINGTCYVLRDIIKKITSFSEIVHLSVKLWSSWSPVI